ncbi:MAG: hypothetical protein AAGK05_19320, partial [Pseudomonadota bacterium]
EGHRQPVTNTLTTFGKSLWQVRNTLRIRGDILYQLDKDNKKYRFVVVSCMVEGVLGAFHDELGHFGVHKIMQ